MLFGCQRSVRTVSENHHHTSPTILHQNKLYHYESRHFVVDDWGMSLIINGLPNTRSNSRCTSQAFPVVSSSHSHVHSQVLQNVQERVDLVYK